MEYLALVYTALRDFPLVVFAMKTVRVSICFLEGELPKWAVGVFRSEWRIVGISLGYVALIFVLNLLELELASDGITPHSARVTF